jgi:hypothetical protein
MFAGPKMATFFGGMFFLFAWAGGDVRDVLA